MKKNASSVKNNTVSKANSIPDSSIWSHVNGKKLKNGSSDPVSLNKDIFPSIENVCQPRNGLDICNGRESFSKTQQHGELQPASEDLYFKQCHMIGTRLESEPSYIKKLSSTTKAPSHIHLYKTKNKTSSQRTQIGSIAHVAETENMSFVRRKNHNKKYNKKKKRINEKFIHVELPSGIKRKIIYEKDILEKYIVFDGGDKQNPKIQRPPDLNKTWKSIRVQDKKHLHVVMSSNHKKGLIHRAENGTPNLHEMKPWRSYPKMVFPIYQQLYLLVRKQRVQR